MAPGEFYNLIERYSSRVKSTAFRCPLDSAPLQFAPPGHKFYDCDQSSDGYGYGSWEFLILAPFLSVFSDACILYTQVEE